MKKTSSFILVLILATALLLTGCGGKGSDYKKAMALYEEGQYLEAADQFAALGDYEDSQEMVKACRYEGAKVLLSEGSYDEAKNLFAELGSYEKSADYVLECDYGKACALFESGDYETALPIFESLGTYNDSAAKVEEAKTAIMLQKYGDVLDALDGNFWFYNGGNDTTLNRISFSGTTATIAQVTFDGNGKHDNGSKDYPITVDDNNIIVDLGSSELKISYTLSGSKITLGKNEYFTADDVNAGIQGYWKSRVSMTIFGTRTVTEKNIYFSNGGVVSEKASLANGSTSGEYYYFGPYEGTYKINFGGFDTNMSHGSEWFFNIVNGKVVVLDFDHLCERTNSLPGQYGYSF